MVYKSGRNIDFGAPSSGGGGSGISPAQTIIIEQNLGVQIDEKEKYTEIAWSNKLPSKVEKYTDNTKSKKLWTITPTFNSDGVPIKVVRVNEDDGISETITIGWANGVPVSVSKG